MSRHCFGLSDLVNDCRESKSDFFETNKQKKPVCIYCICASIVILECVIDLPFVEDVEGVALH